MVNKVAIICDSHFGVKSDAHNFYDYFKEFNDQVFFKEIDKQGVDTVLHLGDVFDRRKYINYLTAKRAREDFFQPLVNRDIDCHFIVGNHDVTYKNTNGVNSLTEMLSGYPKFKVYTEPTDIEIKENKFLLLPWINEENFNDSIKMIQTTKATICFGHLSINGFLQHRGQVREGTNLEDLDKSLFDRFDIVASGHFHHKSSKDNIHYLGSPYEFTWADYNDTKGFHILDLDTKKFTFYQNPFKKYHMVSYDDVNALEKAQKDIKETDFSHINNNYVKVVVVNRTNPYVFDLFLDKLYKSGPVDISLVENESTFIENDNTGELEHVEDTITLIGNYIDGLELNLDSGKMKSMMKGIYQEAMLLEDI